MPAVETPLPTLWAFSVACYSRSHVAEVCLRLQDMYGININVLLWAEWLKRKHILLTPERLVAALAKVQSWDVTYVEALRALRRMLKTEFVDNPNTVSLLREHIKQAELAAEKYEQECLELIAADWSRVDAIPPDNIRGYLVSTGLPESVITEVVAAFSAYA